MKDRYQRRACEFRNESECREEFDDNQEDMEEFEKKHFDEDSEE